MAEPVFPRPEAREAQEDSLKKRYFYKLVTNFAGLLIGLVTQAIIPRGLGPALYGDYNFLTSFFSQFIGSLEAGTSTCFYTKLSQRPQDRGLIKFYWGFSLVVGAGMIVFVLAVWGLDLAATTWPDQSLRYIWMGMIWGLLYHFTQTVNTVLDAYGLTVPSEIVRLQQKILALSLVLCMFLWARFTLAQFFVYQYIVFLLLVLGWWRVMKRGGLVLFPMGQLTRLEVKQYGREFYAYSGPLITHAIVALIVGVLDRWLLQNFAGSVEQGFYGLSYQIGTMCFLFTSAMVPLFIREMSKAHGNEDSDLMRRLFQRFIPMLYSVAAFLGVFIAVQARTVGAIFGGGRYANATPAIALMALYPIYQTYGQLSGAVFFATGRTQLYRNLGILTMVFGLPMTYWLLAPTNRWGLNLGATGLALKTLLMAVVAINLQLWFNARLLKLSFLRFVAHQLYSLLLFAVIAQVAVIGVSQLITARLPAFLVSGFLYTLGGAAILVLFPAVFAVTRADLRNQLAQLRGK